MNLSIARTQPGSVLVVSLALFASLTQGCGSGGATGEAAEGGSGSGGNSTATGGNSTATGGNSTATGGNSTTTGGNSTANGGAPDGNEPTGAAGGSEQGGAPPSVGGSENAAGQAGATAGSLGGSVPQGGTTTGAGGGGAGDDAGGTAATAGGAAGGAGAPADLGGTGPGGATGPSAGAAGSTPGGVQNSGGADASGGTTNGGSAGAQGGGTNRGGAAGSPATGDDCVDTNDSLATATDLPGLLGFDTAEGLLCAGDVDYYGFSFGPCLAEFHLVPEVTGVATVMFSVLGPTGDLRDLATTDGAMTLELNLTGNSSTPVDTYYLRAAHVSGGEVGYQVSMAGLLCL